MPAATARNTGPPDLPIPGKLVDPHSAEPEKTEAEQVPAAEPSKAEDEIPKDFTLPITKEGQSEIITTMGKYGHAPDDHKRSSIGKLGDLYARKTPPTGARPAAVKRSWER